VVVVVELVALVVLVVTPRSSGVPTLKTARLAASAAQGGAGGAAAPPLSGRRPPATTTTTAPPPPTTVPTTTPTTVPAVPVEPAPTLPPPPHAVSAPGHAILPPNNPPASIAPDPNFLDSCSATGYDNSSGCTQATLAAIDNGRAAEGLPGMGLPSNWSSLTSQEQLYVGTNLERTVRGLPALSSMASALDGAAAAGADTGNDPSPPAGFFFYQWGASWAGGVGNPLEAIYYWMYDDGPGSSNADCTPGHPSGCWGHRDEILLSLSCTPCVMGTGFNPHGWNNQPSWAEILVGTNGSPAADFTWQQEAPFLA
jgi:hypothetical protein